MRLQAIDIGTNSVRSIVVDASGPGTFRIIDDEKEQTRLGTSLLQTGRLSDDAMQRTVEALRAMLEIGRNQSADEVRAIATAAVRIAANGREFVARLHDELGLEVEVVSETEEGRLVYLSAAANFELAGSVAVVDIGGGSVEIIRALDGQIAQIVSNPIGVRVLAEQFVTEDPISEASFKRLRKHVRRTLKASVDDHGGVTRLVASGGTSTTLAAILSRPGSKPPQLQGFDIRRTEVVHLLPRLMRMTTEERRKVPGLPPERADIIIPGAIVLAETMRLFGAEDAWVNARGIREGIVLDVLQRDGGALSTGVDRLAAARELGERCHYDEVHAGQVARLATSLFDQLQGELDLDPADRSLLEAAALVHDIGYHIGYDRHHKHSYHLISHAQLPGFTHREREALAAIARYHTKSLPKPKHAEWAELDDAWRARVAQLAALLRVADGLDRSRGARIDEVHARVDGGVVRLELTGDGDLHAERYGVDKKKDLFEQVFERQLVVDAVLGATPGG